MRLQAKIYIYLYAYIRFPGAGLLYIYIRIYFIHIYDSLYIYIYMYNPACRPIHVYIYMYTHIIPRIRTTTHIHTCISLRTHTYTLHTVPVLYHLLHTHTQPSTLDVSRARERNACVCFFFPRALLTLYDWSTHACVAEYLLQPIVWPEKSKTTSEWEKWNREEERRGVCGAYSVSGEHGIRWYSMFTVSTVHTHITLRQLKKINFSVNRNLFILWLLKVYP